MSREEGIDYAHTTGDYRNFINLVTKCTDESLDLWLNMCVNED